MIRRFSRSQISLTLTGLFLFLLLPCLSVQGGSTFLNVVDSFKTVDEIVNPTSAAKIRTMAALADMSMAEFANFAIKRLVIRKGVLEQPVIIDIGGKKVTLSNPHPCVAGLDLPLRYSDFVVDRSGPKFLGALNADVAVETLMAKDQELKLVLASANEKDPKRMLETNIVEVTRRLAKARLWADAPPVPGFTIKPEDTLPTSTKNKYLTMKEAEAQFSVDGLTSLFLQEHMVQRRLSDFDLTARDTETFALAIGAKLGKMKSGTPSRDFLLEIGRIAWQQGGPIDPALIDAALAAAAKSGKPDSAPQFYAQAIAKDPRFFNGGKPDAQKFYHVLFTEVGPLVKKLLTGSEPHIDAGYGLGIPYYGPEVEENPKTGTLAFKKDKSEIGDVICDETSHYRAVFSHNINMTLTLEKLKKTSAIGVDKKLNLRDNFNAWLERTDKSEFKRFQDEAAFIDAVLMFEQIAKKEAQGQLFKAEKKLEKLIGNVSDVGQFLVGVGQMDHGAVFTDVVKLSSIVAMPRWGINSTNLAAVNDTASIITPQVFADSINDRSYRHVRQFDPKTNQEIPYLDPLSPRLHLEWSGIDEKIAKLRLDDYTKGMKTTWEFVRKQSAYFGLVDKLIETLRAKGDIGPDRTAIRNAVATIVAEELKALHDKVDGTGKLEAFLDSITDQVVESANFFLIRTAKR